MRIFGFLATLLMALPVAAADDAKTGFLDKTIEFDGETAKYVVFVPPTYDGTKAFPVILFLHGSGETGTDGKKQATVGLAPAIRKREKEFPFIAIFPQSQKRTWLAESKDGKRAMAIFEAVSKEYKTDPNRVVLTGLSMGGFGTWSLAAAHPDRWSCLVPVCGGGSTELVKRYSQIPVWCFHGGADPVVKAELSHKVDRGAQRGRREAGAEVHRIPRRRPQLLGQSVRHAGVVRVDAGTEAEEVRFLTTEAQRTQRRKRKIEMKTQMRLS